MSKTILLERYTETVEEVLSVAKAPKIDGEGYLLYPIRGRSPFAEAFMTNRRKAILGMLGERNNSELIYR